MKNKLIYGLALMLASTTIFAQNKETRSVDTFTIIAFRTPGKCYVKQGSPQKVELEGKKEVLSKIETKVTGGKLVIGAEGKWSNWNWHNDDDIIVYITVQDIDGIAVSGSGDLIAQTKITGDDFDISVSGSGSLQAEVQASGRMNANVSGSGGMNLKGSFADFESSVSGSGDIDLNATISGTAEFGLSGSGKVRATGSAESVKATISGSGKVLASNLETDKCEVRISGSGDVEINVKKELEANISGSGTVSYKGNPSHVNSHASGSGNIHKL